MTEATEGSGDAPISFKVKTSGEGNHSVTMPESATVLDLKTKLSTAEFENIPVERQRLIYSGRVMKNEEPLATYKIKSGNTVHLVKSAASNPTPAPSSTSSQSAPARPQVPTNMAAGTANNPLAGLTGARYAGLTGLPSADMFGPDGGMVGPMMDEDAMNRMLSDPNVLQQMNEMLNNDQFLDMMIQQNPMLRSQPNARELLRSPMFRQMMTNPEAIRSAQRFGSMMRGGGAGGGGQSAFPAPGVTDTTPQDRSTTANSGNANDNAGQPNPFDPAALAQLQGLMGGQGGNNANPLAGLFNPFGAGAFGQPPAGTQTGTGAAQTEGGNTTQNAATIGSVDNAANPTSPSANPFASLFGGAQPGAGGANANNPFGLPPISPEALQQMMGIMGMGSPGGGSPAPPDNRPPEERYAEQLRQLNDMGFYDFDRNVAALRRSGGSVQGAIEHLLSS
ncbi:hypothetical protein BKA67DRAFT_655451 [Truncatella angustata]|uniref:Deubiquitination-protection protein dph1 n=1 Tax=Truncatella angustata TaxID=152316 RepID=A0A9P8UQK1_9PEZI|nr:uncharacterized protein BKA67DRAFT_655451 [Truncatella angustata]KAH6657160.1 hypothetical protein BKA67DRAFT_655451 [Truncatella angustata]KAH8197602.1 hypothetical protein TruAng_008234 [Truncatella angustata]